MPRRKNFFVKPLTKGAIRRLKRELGSTGMSREAIDARVNQILQRQQQGISPEDLKAKHMFVQGGLPGLGRRS